MDWSLQVCFYARALQQQINDHPTPTHLRHAQAAIRTATLTPYNPRPPSLPCFQGLGNSGNKTRASDNRHARAPKNLEPPKTGSGSTALDGSGSGIFGPDPQGASTIGILSAYVHYSKQALICSHW